MQRLRVTMTLMMIMNASCAPSANPTPPRRQSQGSSKFADCRAGQREAPDQGLNFDIFVATTADLVELFPGSRPPRSSPVERTITKVSDPLDGRVIAGPFDPPLVVHSYEPDDDGWAGEETRVDLAEASLRKLPWVQCGGLAPEGFEALGDALGLPRPTPQEVQRLLGVIPERLTTPIFLPPKSGGIVGLFPEAFESALAAAGDAAELGGRWSVAFRERVLEANASAKALGFTGRKEPPPDAERLRPYFVGLAQDVVQLAKQAQSTQRNLYVHHWPD